MDEEGWGIPSLELEGSGSLPVQIASALRTAILNGRLAPGSRLPSSRRLAAALGHSRPVVTEAFGQLRAEGWVETRTGSGTYVTSELPTVEHGVRTAPPSVPASPPLSALARRLLDDPSPRWERGGALPADAVDLRAGALDRADFPWVEWRRCYGRVARDAEGWRGIFEDPAGPHELRSLLAVYLRRRRGVRADPDRIVVVSGSQQGLQLIADVLLEPGDEAALEEPHYPSAYRCLHTRRARVHPVPVDARGLDPSGLPSTSTRLAYLTPSHQFPTGTTLSIERRLAVLSWADEVDAFVLEDDYDSELRFSGRSAPSLQGQDRSGRVIYLGSLSKVLLPEIRLGYLILPPSLVDVVRRAKWERDRHTDRLQQLAAAEFIRRGHLGRRVRRLRRKLGGRRRELVTALRARLGDRIEILGDEAGLHVMVRLLGVDPGQARAVAEAAADEGLVVSTSHDCYITPPPRAELLLGYGGPAPSAGFDAVAECLLRAVERVGG